MKKPNTDEQSVQGQAWIEAGNQGYTLFRNNVGKAWQGKMTNTNKATILFQSGRRRILGRSIVIEAPRQISFGLFKGSSDLIGYKSVVITPDMVGQTIAVFTGLECKPANGGKKSNEQKTFGANVLRAGGIFAFVRSNDDIPEGPNGK